jgi:hypothetical protein
MPGGEGAHRAGHGDPGHEADRERRGSVGGLPHPAVQSLRGGQQGARVLQQLTARGRQLGGLLVPGEQLRAQFLLQRADLPGQHRLRDVQPLGGPPEVQFLGHDHEVTQLAQIDIHDISYGVDAMSSLVSPEGGARSGTRAVRLPCLKD